MFLFLPLFLFLSAFAHQAHTDNPVSVVEGGRGESPKCCSSIPTATTVTFNPLSYGQIGLWCCGCCSSLQPCRGEHSKQEASTVSEHGVVLGLLCPSSFPFPACLSNVLLFESPKTVFLTIKSHFEIIRSNVTGDKTVLNQFPQDSVKSCSSGSLNVAGSGGILVNVFVSLYLLGREFTTSK